MQRPWRSTGYWFVPYSLLRLLSYATTGPLATSITKIRKCPTDWELGRLPNRQPDRERCFYCVNISYNFHRYITYNAPVLNKFYTG